MVSLNPINFYMLKIWNYFRGNILKFGVSFLLIFIPLYPKLPSVHIAHTWVYIRLEDFFIALVVGIWLLQLILKKAKLPPKLWMSIGAYWVAGLLSLVFSLIFLAPHLANFFPSVAILFYARGIEYMILFFVAFSSVKNARDLRDYLIVLGFSVLAFSIYAFGQRFYLDLWHAFPKFFEHLSYCFPSYQTGNEEFAKGIPLCLPTGARITSTFAGHYDLGAYMVLVIPIFVALIFAVKKNIHKILIFGLTLISMMVIIFTSSRISFIAYILGVTFTLVWLNKKKFIIPFYALSLILLLIFSGSTAKRFMETFRFASVVINNQGQVVGQSELPDDLKKKISNNVLANVPTQNLPVGSGYFGLPQLKAPEKTDKAIIQSSLSLERAKKLKLENGGVEISTISGSFLIKKVLVYDISFTTRFQAEWPNAWGAMLRNPLLGSGFATITLAADNNYLRILGETGILGLVTFISIFILILILFRQALALKIDTISKAYILGIGGGVIGLFINAILIDVFEASKVSETLWLLLGIGVGAAYLYAKKFEYKKYIVNVLSSHFFVFIYLFFLSLVFYINSFKNFFVADDFTWLKWAATTNLSDLPKLFTNSQGFFYRPMDKLVMYFLYTLFSFNSVGYHAVMFLIHFAIAIGLYVFINRIFRNKLFSFIGAFIFLFLPSAAENVYWISTISVNLGALFIIYGLLFWQKFRSNSSKRSYVLTFVFAILALLSYEIAVVFPLLLIVFDLFIANVKKTQRLAISYIPFLVLIPIYLTVRTLSHTVAAGGDYAYSIAHLVPNFIGNTLGYFALMIFGEKTLPLYSTSRDLLKGQPALFVAVFVAIAVVIIAFVFTYRKKFIALFANTQFKYALFALVFIFVSLLPFLGLGNITERYSYLASIGFAFLVVSILMALTKLVKNQNYKLYLLAFILLVVGSFYYVSDMGENSQWHEAGRITNRTLAYLRLYLDGKRSNSNFYFVNTPIRKANAWIFPVGLSDGIWFIYRDDTIRIYKTGSISEGKSSLIQGVSSQNYLFAFDKNGNIYEIK